MWREREREREWERGWERKDGTTYNTFDSYGYNAHTRLPFAPYSRHLWPLSSHQHKRTESNPVIKKTVLHLTHPFPHTDPFLSSNIQIEYWQKQLLFDWVMTIKQAEQNNWFTPHSMQFILYYFNSSQTIEHYPASHETLNWNVFFSPFINKSLNVESYLLIYNWIERKAFNIGFLLNYPLFCRNSWEIEKKLFYLDPFFVVDKVWTTFFSWQMFLVCFCEFVCVWFII